MEKEGLRPHFFLKNWDTQTNTIIILKKQNSLGFQCNNAVKIVDGMANSVDPDQTAPKRSTLAWVCTVCSDISFL